MISGSSREIIVGWSGGVSDMLASHGNGGN